ncbi:MAG: glycosyltransferase family 2 protein [Proteobacteria bacterium]|nr:glycosyltransferase family 2 protein [Pseudomonadota bacterium]MDG2274122.1 glycosyltransferase family A protein [Halioglobus sp.]
MNDPLVSVIVAVYNGENFLAQALESVMAQSYVNFEVLIVDDGSTDKTKSIAERFLNDSRCRYIFQANGGHASAMNIGVSNAGGELLAFIDHDDLWDRRKLALQVNALRESPNLDMVFTHWKNFLESGSSGRLKFQHEGLKGYATGTMLIRKEAFLKVGDFDTTLTKGYFFPWYDRSRILGVREFVLPNLLYHRRVHGENISIGKDAEDYKDYFAAIRKVRQQRDQ